MTRLESGCKINLGLRIYDRGANGYHDLETFFLPLPWPRDRVLIEKKPGSGLKIECDVPLVGTNILAKIYELYSAKTGYAPGLCARLQKRVPVGAGLGGGSANAAIFALWLNSTAPNPLSERELSALCRETGADVPFFLLNRPAFGRGEGHVLYPAENMAAGLFVILVCPEIFVSTAAAYAALDRARADGKVLTKPRADNKNFPFSSPDLPDLANDLEEPVFAAYPELSEIKGELSRTGAIGAAMSGSGSTIYGLFDDATLARNCVKTLRRRHKRVFFAST